VSAVGVAVLALTVVALRPGWEVDGAVPFLVAVVVLVVLVLVRDRVHGFGGPRNAGGAQRGALLGRIAFEAGVPVVQELERLGVADLAACHQYVHHELPKDDATRIRLEDHLVSMAAERAFDLQPDAEVLNAAIQGRSLAARAVGFGLAKGHPERVTLAALESGVLRPRSSNEQYHALVVAEKKLPVLDARGARRLLATIDSAPHLDEGTPARFVAERIRRTLSERR
jgi:hypothetical protein